MSEITVLERLCDFAIELSNGKTGRDTDWRNEQISLAFAKLGVTCASFLRLIPDSAYFGPAKGITVWDLSSAASLCRNIMESYYVLRYLVKDLEEEEAAFRKLLWHYHKASERHKMLAAALPDSSRWAQVVEARDKLRNELKENPHFLTLGPELQVKLLKGDKFKVHANDQLSREAGISVDYYHSQYKYCSAFVHSAPFSISALADLEAVTPEARTRFRTLVGIATGYMAVGIRDFCECFPYQKATLPADIRECISYCEEILKWEDLPGLRQSIVSTRAA
jgi:hypothetical protein